MQREAGANENLRIAERNAYAANLLVIQSEQGRDAINKYYDNETSSKAARVRTLRSKAVARYEEFLQLHPNDPVWTPEIMLRLGQILFEGASERFQQQMFFEH